MGGGCAGMCQEPMPYSFEIEKQVPGEIDRFVDVHRFPNGRGASYSSNLNLTLDQLCNGDRSARIKFVLRSNYNNAEIASVVTSIEELVEKPVHNAGGET